MSKQPYPVDSQDVESSHLREGIGDGAIHCGLFLYLWRARGHQGAQPGERVRNGHAQPIGRWGRRGHEQSNALQQTGTQQGCGLNAHSSSLCKTRRAGHPADKRASASRMHPTLSCKDRHLQNGSHSAGPRD